MTKILGASGCETVDFANLAWPKIKYREILTVAHILDGITACMT